jgi:hypothetical protein
MSQVAIRIAAEGLLVSVPAESSGHAPGTVEGRYAAPRLSATTIAKNGRRRRGGWGVGEER